MNIYDGCPIYHEDFHSTPIIKTTSKTHKKGHRRFTAQCLNINDILNW